MMSIGTTEDFYVDRIQSEGKLFPGASGLPRTSIFGEPPPSAPAVLKTAMLLGLSPFGVFNMFGETTSYGVEEFINKVILSFWIQSVKGVCGEGC